GLFATLLLVTISFATIFLVTTLVTTLINVHLLRNKQSVNSIHKRVPEDPYFFCLHTSPWRPSAAELRTKNVKSQNRVTDEAATHFLIHTRYTP
ncbi:hypothetical protein FRC20_004848, partial [Serendipita sp. 405]